MASLILWCKIKVYFGVGHHTIFNTTSQHILPVSLRRHTGHLLHETGKIGGIGKIKIVGDFREVFPRINQILLDFRNEPLAYGLAGRFGKVSLAQTVELHSADAQSLCTFLHGKMLPDAAE